MDEIARWLKQYIIKSNDVIIQGHRGFSASYPENTMLAFRQAVLAGASSIECDVQATSDGVFIIMHDLTVDRTTDGTGTVAALTAEYIAGLDASNSFTQYAGQVDTKVPTLTQVLDEFEGTDVIVQLHLGVTETQAQEIIDDVVSRGMIKQVIWSDSTSLINAIKTYNPACKTQNDGMPNASAYEAVLANAVSNGHECVSVLASALTKEIVDAIHAAGKLVHASYVTAGYTTTTEYLMGIGVDYILGNDPETMKTAALNRGFTLIRPPL